MCEKIATMKTQGQEAAERPAGLPARRRRSERKGPDPVWTTIRSRKKNTGIFSPRSPKKFSRPRKRRRPRRKREHRERLKRKEGPKERTTKEHTDRQCRREKDG